MSAESLTGSARRAAHPILFAVLAPPVLAATALNGFWLGKGILVALAGWVLRPSWGDAFALLASIAGIQGMLVVFRSWRALQAAGAEPASSDRKTLVVVATLAAAAAVGLLADSAGRPHVADGTAPLMDAPWFPGLRLGLLAISAALLALVPGPSRAAADQLWWRQLRGRPHELSRTAGKGARAAGAGASHASAGVVHLLRGSGAALRSLAMLAGAVAGRALLAIGLAVQASLATVASVLWPSDRPSTSVEGSVGGVPTAPRPRLGAFALMAVPVLYVVLTLGGLLVEYGVTLLIMIVGIVLLPLMVLAAGGLAALVRLWWALLDAQAAPTWARVMAGLALPLAAALAWLWRDTTDGHLLALDTVVAGVHVTPPIAALVVVAALLLLHALPRWSARAERGTRVLALLALIAVVSTRFVR